MSPTSARDSALGYMHQFYYALNAILEEEPSSKVIVERLDDVELDCGDLKQLVQVKRHRRQANLTDSSEDIWKSIGNWIDVCHSGNVIIRQTHFLLVTTSTIPENSLAYYLSMGNKSELNAIQRMDEIAKTSTNKELQKHFKKYLLLSEEEKREFLRSVSVLGDFGQPEIIEEHIKKAIRYTTLEHLDQVFERLIGWWMQWVVRSLNASGSLEITNAEIHQKIYEITDQYRSDSLPIEFLDAELPDGDLSKDNRFFVQQLREIGFDIHIIEIAVKNYYRAFSQRSKWARDNLLIDGEIEKYEKRLIEEWENIFHALKNELPADASDKVVQHVGRKIYNSIMTTLDIPIRPRVTEKYVMRGSYHILADKNPPPVYWHPLFREKVYRILVEGSI